MPLISMQSQEEIKDLFQSKYSTTDVLKTAHQKVRRNAHLIKAVALESIAPCEVDLVIEDELSCKMVKSRIIAKADDRVMLENGMTLPIGCIHQVRFE